MNFITSKNNKLKKERNRSSINRSINKITTGFTMNIHPEYIAQNIISDPTLLSNNVYTERDASKDDYKRFKNFIKNTYLATIEKIINSTQYIFYLLGKKGDLNSDFKDHSVSTNELEDTIPIRKPFAGSSGYEKNLNKLKFIE